MSATGKLVREVYAEEVAALASTLGQLNQWEGWFVFDGHHTDGRYVEQASAVDKVVADRTGLSFDRVRDLRPSSAIMPGTRARRLLFSLHGLEFDPGYDDDDNMIGYRPVEAAPA